MTTEKPLVSILINNFNYGRYLPLAIESALSQSYFNVEVIVVDDGSTDHSRDIIDKYEDRVVAILKDNGGQASALNAGFAASSGDIICFLDADDVFLPEKVDEVVKLFGLCSNNDWVFTESAPIESEILESKGVDYVFDSIRVSSPCQPPRKIDFRDDLRAAKIPDFAPSTSNLSFSKKLLEKIFPLPEIKGFSGMAITDLYIKLLALGLGVGHVSIQQVGIYRFHNNLYRTSDSNKKRRMFAEIYTTSGFWINARFPEFRKMSKKLLSKGFSTYLSTSYLRGKSSDANLDEMVKSYLDKSSFFEKIEIKLMILYYRLRLSFQELV